MKEKDKNLWLELYEVAKNIQKLEPWKYLWDQDLLGYISREYNNIFYCSVMGKAGIHRALAIYEGEKINSFYELSDNKYPEYLLLNYQECIVCNFSRIDEVLPENKKIMKDLGIKFRGTWISFEYMEKGYEPSKLNIKQVEKVTNLLKNFFMMFRTIIEKGTLPDFEDGEFLLRSYDEDKKLFVNYIAPLMIPEKNYRGIGTNEKFREDMLKLPQTKEEIEFEFLNFVPFRIEDLIEKDGRHYFPLSRIVAKRKSGEIVYNNFIDKNTYKNIDEYVLDNIYFLSSYFQEYGRPKSIYVRDKETEMYLKEIMESINIKLVVKSELKAIDDFYLSLFEIGY